MPDVLARPDLQRLLHEADTVRRLLVDVGDDADVRMALDGIHLELGRLLHEIVSPTPAPAVEEEPVQDLPRRPDDEESTAGRTPPARDAILNFDDTDPGVSTDPGVAPAGVAPDPAPATPPAKPHLVPIADGAAPWVAALRLHLDLVALPASLDDPAELAAEVTRVQWCTVDVAARWEPFPESIRVALLGLLASRARHLRDVLDVDTGPRLALDRLRAYRKASGLPPVVGLLPDRGPELATWSQDARRWWDALVGGLTG